MRSGLDLRVAQHVLHVQRDEEEHRIEARQGGHLGHVRGCQPADPEDRQWHERIALAPFVDQSATAAQYPLGEMTDLLSAAQLTSAEPTLGKRDRLVAAARRVLHEQGVERTTLGDIAGAADVRVGSVYYYFKTKDELVAAAIDAHADDVQRTLASFDHRRGPKARLKAFVRMVIEQRDLTARYGCPQGSLCSELDKRDDGRYDHYQAQTTRPTSLVVITGDHN
jgi:hypothetical protein